MKLSPSIAAFQSSIERLCALAGNCSDLAELNLRAAQLFVGIDEPAVANCLSTLDRWTELVDRGTRNFLPRFRAAPNEYWNSEPCFRVLVMTTILQRNIGVAYNFAFVEGEWDASDARNLFIHGPLQGFGGTCSTLPVIYAAIGHRLGYPISLVETREHLFCRWDDGNERFNFEASGSGFAARDDEYYRHWPYEISQKEVAMNGYLSTLSRTELLASFVSNGGQYLRDTMKYAKSLIAFNYASRLAPDKGPLQDEWFIAIWVHRIAMGIASLKLSREEFVSTPYRNIVMRGSPSPANEGERLGIDRAQQELMRIDRNLSRNSASASLDAVLSTPPHLWEQVRHV